MIKHCNDKTAANPDALEMNGAHGLIMGVLKKEIGQQYLLVTSTVP